MFHRARKGLGAITETEDSAWVVKATKEGDTLATLARGYGVTPAEITKQNGIKFSTGAIQEWVKATGGKVLPWVAGNSPYKDRKEGWAVFTTSSRIRLPAHARSDGEPAPPAGELESAGLTPSKSGTGAKVILFAGLAAAAWLVWATPGKKKKPAHTTTGVM